MDDAKVQAMPTLIGDGFENLIARTGTPRDKAHGGTWVDSVVSDVTLLAAYRTSWLVRKVVNIPPQDMVKLWRRWKADKEVITQIEAEEKRLKLRLLVKQAAVAARLFGYAGIYISVPGQGPGTPLDPQTVGQGGVKRLTLIGKDRLTAGEVDQDPDSEYFGQPMYWNIGVQGNMIRVHPSRLAMFYGGTNPAGAMAMESVYDSAVKPLLDSVRNADSASANIASLVYEAKVDIIHLPRLMELMRKPDGEKEVFKYLNLLAMGKGINGMLLLDGGNTAEGANKSGGTQYDSKAFTFAGLADVWDRMHQAVAGGSDIPMTRLVGTSPAGMNSTGESDMRNYYDHVKSLQELEVEPALAILDECLLRSATGARDDSITFDWVSLWQATEEQRVNMCKAMAETITSLKNTGLFPTEVLQQAAVNTLIEGGTLVGLEQAVDEFGLELDEVEEGGLDGETNPNVVNQQPGESAPQGQRVADMAPAPLYISRPVVNKAAILAWAKAQGLTVQESNQLHVTVAYSNAPVDWMKMGTSWDETLSIAAGGPRVLEQFGEHVVLSFASDSLRWRHEQVMENGGTHDFPNYQPHITLFKGTLPEGVQAYTGRIVLGPEIFEELRNG